jgi:hypothetical protein
VKRKYDELFAFTSVEVQGQRRYTASTINDQILAELKLIKEQLQSSTGIDRKISSNNIDQALTQTYSRGDQSPDAREGSFYFKIDGKRS